MWWGSPNLRRYGDGGSPYSRDTGRICAAIQRPLEDLRLKAGTVCDGRAMGNDGFGSGTNSLCGWSSAKECRSRVRARSLVLFLLSPFSWAVFVKMLLQRFYLLTKNLNKHGEKEAANTVHHRLVSPCYTLSPAEPITITHCTSLEA